MVMISIAITALIAFVTYYAYNQGVKVGKRDGYQAAQLTSPELPALWKSFADIGSVTALDLTGDGTREIISMTIPEGTAGLCDIDISQKTDQAVRSVFSTSLCLGRGDRVLFRASIRSKTPVIVLFSGPSILDPDHEPHTSVAYYGWNGERFEFSHEKISASTNGDPVLAFPQAGFTSARWVELSN